MLCKHRKHVLSKEFHEIGWVGWEIFSDCNLQLFSCNCIAHCNDRSKLCRSLTWFSESGSCRNPLFWGNFGRIHYGKLLFWVVYRTRNSRRGDQYVLQDDSQFPPHARLSVRRVGSDRIARARPLARPSQRTLRHHASPMKGQVLCRRFRSRNTLHRSSVPRRVGPRLRLRLLPRASPDAVPPRETAREPIDLVSLVRDEYGEIAGPPTDAFQSRLRPNFLGFQLRSPQVLG
jgi:hypothetical protein